MEAATISSSSRPAAAWPRGAFWVSDELAGDGRLRIEQEDLDRLGEAVAGPARRPSERVEAVSAS